MNRKYPIPNIGDKVGLITITSIIKDGYRQYVSGVCDCGNGVGPMLSSDIYRRNTEERPRSCLSCAQKRNGARLRKENSKYAKSTAIGSYKNRSKSKGIEWGITDDEFFSMCQLPCTYCGSENTNTVSGARDWRPDYSYTGIDRIDSSLGYIVGNIQPCCKQCNRAKSDLEESEFLAWARKVANCGKK